MSRPKKINPDAVLQPIAGAAYITGLSQKYIREGCKTGKIPHLRIGKDYRVYIPEFLEQLAAESKTAERVI